MSDMLSQPIGMIEEKEAVAIQFQEDMHGFYANQTDGIEGFGQLREDVYGACAALGEEKKQRLQFRLTICIHDMENFLENPKLPADASGTIYCPELGGQLDIEQGCFHLFATPMNSQDMRVSKEMHYRLHFKDRKQQPWTFYGYKALKQDDLRHGWQQASTLYARLFEGHITSFPTPQTPWAQGILTMDLRDFLKQLTSIGVDGPHLSDRMKAALQFFEFYAERLLKAFRNKDRF